MLARGSVRGQARPGPGDSDGSESGGGTEQGDHIPHQNVFGQSALHSRHTRPVDAKASPTGAGFVPGGGPPGQGSAQSARQAQPRDGLCDAATAAIAAGASRSRD